MSQEDRGVGASSGGNRGGAGGRDNSKSPASSSRPNDNNSSSASPNVDLAQALRDLARGEQAANSLEAELDKFDRKLNEMLTSMGVDPKMLDDDDVGSRPQGGGPNGTEGKK